MFRSGKTEKECSLFPSFFQKLDGPEVRWDEKNTPLWNGTNIFKRRKKACTFVYLQIFFLTRVCIMKKTSHYQNKCWSLRTLLKGGRHTGWRKTRTVLNLMGLVLKTLVLLRRLQQNITGVTQIFVSSPGWKNNRWNRKQRNHSFVSIQGFLLSVPSNWWQLPFWSKDHWTESGDLQQDCFMSPVWVTCIRESVTILLLVISS